MQDAFSILCLGWPAIIASVLLSLAGLLWKKPILMAAGGVVLLPFAFYVTAHRIPGIIVPVLQFAAAYAVWRGKLRLAWWLLVPLLAAVLLLTVTALTHSQ